MHASTLGLWRALSVIDPWDANRTDLTLGQVAAASFNAQGCTKREGGVFVAADFMPFLEAQKDPADQARENERSLRAFLMARTRKKA
jgi:hypothetical protein